MPDHENAATHSRARWNKCHPLPEPLGKIVHAVHLCGVNLFKVRFMLMSGFVGGIYVARCSIVECFIQHSVWGWKYVHYAVDGAFSEDPTMRLTGISAETTYSEFSVMMM